ncbi:MAG: TetR/AcrR family transcriptional regulator, partial [Rhodobacteraceae bacterium]
MSAAADTLPGNAKVTRQDWLDAAMDVLVSDGSDRVKILTLADKLEVSR